MIKVENIEIDEGKSLGKSGIRCVPRSSSRLKEGDEFFVRWKLGGDIGEHLRHSFEEADVICTKLVARQTNTIKKDIREES